MYSKIWLSPPHMGGEEEAYIKQAFDLNWIAPSGVNVAGFENDLETYLKEDSHIACVSSGTAAIHIGLILAGIQRGDTVLCQSFTFAASANPITYVGAHPVFVDSERETWNICPVALENAIESEMEKGNNPRALIMVHSYGMPANMTEILKITKKHKIILIEDSAEALGSSYKGQKCGTFGDYGILSFNGNKIITTSTGGALVCRKEQDKQRAIFLTSQAKEQASHYQHSEVGYNYQMSNVLAGIGRGQIQVLDRNIALRKKMHQFYLDIFSDVEGIEVLKEPTKDYDSNHWLSCIVVDQSVTGFSNEDIRLELLSYNIESRPLWKPMHMQPVFESCEYYGGNVAGDLFRDGLCLPSGSNVTDEDRKRIKKALDKVLT